MSLIKIKQCFSFVILVLFCSIGQTIEVPEFEHLQKFYLQIHPKEGYEKIVKIEEYSKIFSLEMRKDFVMSIIVKRLLENTPDSQVKEIKKGNEAQQSYKTNEFYHWIYESFKMDSVKDEKRRAIKDKWLSFLENSSTQILNEKLIPVSELLIDDLLLSLELIQEFE